MGLENYKRFAEQISSLRARSTYDDAHSCSGFAAIRSRVSEIEKMKGLASIKLPASLTQIVSGLPATQQGFHSSLLNITGREELNQAVFVAERSTRQTSPGSVETMTRRRVPPANTVGAVSCRDWIQIIG